MKKYNYSLDIMEIKLTNTLQVCVHVIILLALDIFVHLWVSLYNSVYLCICKTCSEYTYHSLWHTTKFIVIFKYQIDYITLDYECLHNMLIKYIVLGRVVSRSWYKVYTLKKCVLLIVCDYQIKIVMRSCTRRSL